MNLSIQLQAVWMEILGTMALGQFLTRALREGQSHSTCCVFLSCSGSIFTREPSSRNRQIEVSKSRTERSSGRQYFQLESLARSY